MLYNGDKTHPKILLSNYIQKTYNILVRGDIFGKGEIVTQFYWLGLFISSEVTLKAQNNICCHS
jgi:hypothetical protein